MNSSPLDIQNLAARVEKLEAANRRWKLSTAVLLLSGVSILLLGAKPADRIEPQGVIRARTVEAQDFVLKDDDGLVYARFSLIPSPLTKNQNGQPFTAPGSPRRYATPEPVLPGQASLQFYDEKGQLVWSAPTKPQFMTVR